MRKPDWVARLRETVREYERAPFADGRFSCYLFAASCVDAITGSEWTAELKSLYGGHRGAALALKREGGIVAAVNRRLGLAVLGHAARRGDVCLVGPRALGVCTGATVRAFTKAGLDVLPLARVRQHWRVG